MKLERQMVKDVIHDFFKRSEAIKAIGGISYLEFVEGAKIPEGWVRDTELEFFVPPDWESTLSPL